MKIALKHQAIEKKNSEVCSVTEYKLDDDTLDFALSTITGRYPDSNRVVNQQCAELVYILEGEGRVVANDKEQKLSAGDVMVIEAGEKYFLEGQMKLLITCRPAWTKEQHLMVD